MGAELGRAVTIRIGGEVAVDHKGERATHQLAENIVFAVEGDAADAGQQMGDDDGIAFGEMGHDLRRRDLGQHEETESAGFRRLRVPADEVAISLPARQPVTQGQQKWWPGFALFIRDDQVTHQSVQFAAQPRDEGRVPPSGFQLAACRDAQSAGEDMGIGSLQAIEGGFQAKPEQAAGCTEKIVGRGRQQMDTGGVTAYEGKDVVLEAGAIDAVAQFDAGDQLAFRREQIVDRQCGEAGVRCGVAWDGSEVGHGAGSVIPMCPIVGKLWRSVAGKCPLFHGAIALGLGMQDVEAREHVQLEFGDVGNRAYGIGRLDAMIHLETLNELAERAEFSRTCHGANGGQEAAAAIRAGQQAQARGADEPDASEVGDEIEGPIHADTMGFGGDGAVGLIGEDERVGRQQALPTQLLVLGADDAGIGPQDQVGAVIPLGRVRRPAPRNGFSIWKEQMLDLSWWNAGHELDGPEPGAEGGQLFGALDRRQVPVTTRRHHRLPSRFQVRRGWRRYQGESTCQVGRRAQQLNQIGARWKERGVSDLECPGPQFIESQRANIICLLGAEREPAAGCGHVVLQFGPNDGEDMDVDPFDIGDADAIHWFALPVSLGTMDAVW